MKNRHLFHLLLLLGACTLTLLACGDNPTPILVYVTPTPANTVIPSTTPGDTTSVITPADTLVAQNPTPIVATATSTPGAYYGPIIGNSYTPEPLHTPLPDTISVRPCPVIISAPQVPLYESADFASNVVGTATERQRLPVNSLSMDGTTWANTANGWLPLADAQGITQAYLGSMRACDILLGTQPDVTLAGLHVLNDTSNDEVIGFVRRMANSGHPLGTIKGLSGTELILKTVRRISPQTVIIYRSGIPADCPIGPGQTPDPVKTAKSWMATLEPQWDQVDADYYELVNECAASTGWLAPFTIEAMRIANEQSRCLLIFSLPGGNPDMAVFPDLYPAYRYAAEHPCAPGRTHGIAMHAFSIEDGRLASESDVWITFRHRVFYEHLLVDVPEAAHLPVYYTAFGIGGATLMPTCQQIIRDALQYTYQLEEDPYVKGFDIWNVGTGEQWYDITPCLDDLATALITYYGGPR